jgi:hypothetical protein
MQGAVMYLNMSAVLTYGLLHGYAFARTAVRPMKFLTTGIVFVC